MQNKKSGNRIGNWVIAQLDKERDILKNEIEREVSVLRADLTIRGLVKGPDSNEPRSIHLNITGGQIGILNVAGLINSIEQNLSLVFDQGQRETAETVKHLSEAVAASNQMNQDQIRQALEHLEFLSTQVASQKDQRAKPSVVSAIFSALRSAISVGADTAQVWSVWGEKLEAILRTGGLI